MKGRQLSGDTEYTRIFTHKYIIMLRITILHSCKGGLGSRIDLAGKSTNVTRVIAVGPLKLGSEKKPKNEKAVLPGHRQKHRSRHGLCVCKSSSIHTTT